MRNRIMWACIFVAAGGVAVLGVGVQADSPKQATSDEGQIRAALGEWQKLFSPGDQQFTLTGYEHLFATDVVVFDNFSAVSTRLDGFDQYRKTWEKEIEQNFKGWRLVWMEVHKVEVAGDMAYSTMTWFGRGKNTDGEDIHASQHGTHVWRKSGGKWRIAVEHLTGPVKVGGKEMSQAPRK